MNGSTTEIALMGLHGIVGTCVVASGISALVAKKGSDFHRVCGSAFVAGLCAMALIILCTAFLAPKVVSSLGLTFTALACYLVLTSCATVRNPPATLGRFDHAYPVVACLIGIMALCWGSLAALGFKKLDDDIPAAAFFVFSCLAFLSASGDFSVIRRGGLTGAQRLSRHLWRMCFVVYMSVATLFTGPGSAVFPPDIRGSWGLMLPELLVLVLSLFWLTRVKLRDAWNGLPKPVATPCDPAKPM